MSPTRIHVLFDTPELAAHWFRILQAAGHRPNQVVRSVMWGLDLNARAPRGEMEILMETRRALDAELVTATFDDPQVRGYATITSLHASTYNGDSPTLRRKLVKAVELLHSFVDRLWLDIAPRPEPEPEDGGKIPYSELN